MTITRLEAYKYRFKVYVDEEYIGIIQKKTMKQNNLFEGQDIDDLLTLKNIIEEDEYESAKNKVLRQLSFSQKSEKEVIKKLKDDCFSENTISKVLNFLKNYNFINDDYYAKSYTESIKKSGKSKNAIKTNLIKKGFDKELIADSMELVSDEEEYVNALKIAEKKVKSLESYDEYAKAKKLKQFLAYRGFDYCVIDKIICMLVKDNVDNF